jgi:hypothetical protein
MILEGYLLRPENSPPHFQRNRHQQARFIVNEFPDLVELRDGGDRYLLRMQ